MCGRYYYDDTIAEEIGELVEEIDRRVLRQPSGDIHPVERAPVLCGTKTPGDIHPTERAPVLRGTETPGDIHPAECAPVLCGTKTPGDIHPTERAPVLRGTGGAGEKNRLQSPVCARLMRWGFVQPTGRGLLINARAETALQRPMFCEGVLHRRCVIPARHFYEWDAEKEKVTFSNGDGKTLFLAGIYSRSGEEDCFVILTTQANASVRAVHPRMPLVLRENEWQDWIYDDHFMRRALEQTPDMLKAYREYEQQSLFC